MKPQIKRALDSGTKHIVNSTNYMGVNPVYETIELPDSGTTVIQIKKGIPWVNINKLEKSQLPVSF